MMIYLRSFTFILLFSLIYSCSNNTDNDEASAINFDKSKYTATEGLFKFKSEEETGIHFVNEVTDQLIQNIFYYEYSFNGGGVAIGDINNDGLEDVLFSSTVGQNRLYLNLGNLKFKDITAGAGMNLQQGISTGICMIDINSDGFLDIFVNKSGNLTDPNTRTHQLFINNKNLTFKEDAVSYGLNDKSYSTQSYFYDFDLDGDLDLYLLNHPIGWGKQDRLKYNYDAKGKMYLEQDTARTFVTDRLFINDNGKYIDKTKAFGVENLAFGLSATIADFTGDNYPDIYVANDYVQPDQFMVNHKGKGFKNEIDFYFKNISTTSMGGDVFDANNDKQLDLFINDMMPETNKRMKENRSYVNYDAHLIARKFNYHDQFRYNTFQIKNSAGKFSNVAQLTGTAKTDWSWAVLGEDYDHNGHLDIFITNGYYKDLNNADYASFTLDSIKRKAPKEKFLEEWKKAIKSVPLKNYFYANNGNLQFDNVSSIWNAGDASFSNGAAYADLDNDGDLDLVVNNLNAPAFVMENTLNTKKKINYVDVVLQEKSKNNFAIGSELTMEFTDGTFIHKLFNPIRGYMSSCSYRTNIGIPDGKQMKQLIVKWPDGNYEAFQNLKLNGKTILSKGSGTKYIPTAESPEIAFNVQAMNWKHNENEYIDFKGEPLLHLKNSVEGPALAVGDLNGDKKDDIFLGGASGQSGIIYLQNGSGWTANQSSELSKDSLFEDTGAAITDIDGDNDNDLIVISGGYQWNKNDVLYSIRAYENDGKANFKLVDGAFGNKKINAGCIELIDVDNDNDMDVFIGGGPEPLKYPYGEQSALFVNNGGYFNDKTEEWLPEAGKFGITKAAKALDINNDKKMDLVIGGDWQEVRILVNEGGKKFVLKQQELGINGSNGMWQSFAADDLDGDGDQDIIAGNLGGNTFFKASQDKPTCIYAYDYDENKEMDPILCTYFGNKSYPVHSRDRLLAHMTKMRKKVLRYRDYSAQDIDDLFDGKHKKADIFNVFTFESCAFINENGKFKRVALPAMAQLSMLNGISVFNKNKDKYYLLTGNFWDTDFDFGKYDASSGLLLKYSNNQFKVVKTAGLMADQNIRDQKAIMINGKPGFILACNNERPLLVLPQ